MTPHDALLLGNTRRHFFQKCFVGLGQVALTPISSLLEHFPECRSKGTST